MPGFDGTGPRGMGPMTGGGRGFCAPSQRIAGVASRGRRFAGAYSSVYPGLLPQAELELLRNEFNVLQRELEGIEARIRAAETKQNE